MNIIFISPNYPEGRWRYVHALRGLGVNVLGIGDAVEENFPHGLQGCLTDYYRVDDLRNYDAVYRGVAFFAHKYGHPDGIESLNDYWATLEASLRRDFNVVGFDMDYALSVFNSDFVNEAVKSAGLKLIERDENNRPIIPSEAKIIKCCGFVNRYGKLSVLSSYEFSDLPEFISEKNELLSFFSIEPGELLMGKILKILDTVRVKGGFFNFTFALGKEISIVDYSFLPPEEYFADAIACSGSSDVCHIWAADKVGMNMDCHKSPETTVYATRRFDRSYRYSHDRIMSKLKQSIRRYGRCYTGLDITGDYFYIFKADSAKKARETIKFIQVDYSDNGPIAEFPALNTVRRNELRQSAIREKSSYDARMLLSRKVEEKIQQGEAVKNESYEKNKGSAGTRSQKNAAKTSSKASSKTNAKAPTKKKSTTKPQPEKATNK